MLAASSCHLDRAPSTRSALDDAFTPLAPLQTSAHAFKRQLSSLLAATPPPRTARARAIMQQTRLHLHGGEVAPDYGRSLRLQISEAGLQGTMQADAFKALLAYVTDVQGDRQVMCSILEQLKQALDEAGTITAPQVKAAIRQQAGSTRDPDHVVVVDAFSVPRVRYDSIHKRLVEDPHVPLTLQPTADAKVRLYQGRYDLLYQRLRRNRRFAPLNAVQANLPNQMHAQLTPLTGLKGSAGRRCIVAGLINSQEDGSYVLEDEGGSVPIDLAGAAVAAGLVTENCVVVAEGQMHLDGVFRVTAVASPSCEARGDLPATAQKLNFFGGPSLSTEAQVRLELAELGACDDRVVLLSNVWLDRPGTFDALHTLLAGFQDADFIPELMVFMGNFTAAAAAAAPAAGAAAAAAAGPGAAAAAAGGAEAAADYLALREGFTQLGRLIDTYTTIKEGCHFVFVPGPSDPGLGPVLPQPPLPSYFTSELAPLLPRATFATNPCRIRYYTREIVLFRYDLLKQMRRRCLVTPEAEDDTPDKLFSELALTLLQQSSLCPLPLRVQPVHWAHQQALQLYPLPHAVVLADASAPQATMRHEGCVVINPGCLPERLFASYKPIDDEVEPSELPGAGGAPHHDGDDSADEAMAA